jgi:lysophospholipase L1-like esterase
MILLLVILALAALLLIGLVLQRRYAWLRALGKGLLVSYVTILLMLAAGEVYFRYFHTDTEGRLASNNWMARYWQTNSLGYRDREWTPDEYAGKTTVAVVGDSFTAGWGLQNPADRFAEVLARQLGDGYAVFNLGTPGDSTPQELERLKAYPVQTDVVLLQYFLNDIDYAALTLGLNKTPQPVPELAQESFLANYLYSLTNSGFGREYWETEYANYDHPAIWDAHEGELNAFIDYLDSIGARLIVVIFPNLQDPVRSIPYVDRVAQVFESRGHNDVLKMFDEVARWNVADLIVSPRDAHPSVAFSQRVGEMIYAQFFS